jgi:hypothetical protein
MATITLKINERTKAGQAFIEFVNQFVLTNKAVEVVEEKSPYDPEFVKKIKKAQKQKGTIIDTNDVWGSLGLR